MLFDAYLAKGLSEYLDMMQPLIPMFHLAYLILVNRLALFGNRFRSPFEWFVTFHYGMFLFFPFGWLWVQLGKSGPASFARMVEGGIPMWIPGMSFGLSGLHFILTSLLIFLWFSEAKSPQNDFDFRKVRWWSYLVLPVILWGFVYPFRQGGQPGQFIFLGLSGLWGSPFGALMNPTSTVLLGLLTFIFPRVNLKLFIGSASVLLLIALITARSSPLDWPMALLAGFNLLLGLILAIKRKKAPSSSENPEIIAPSSAPRSAPRSVIPK